MRRAPAALILLFALAAALPGSAAAAGTRLFLPIADGQGSASAGVPVATAVPTRPPAPPSASPAPPTPTSTPPPTATPVPPTPTATPDPRGDVVFVFLQGYGSQLPNAGGDDVGFSNVKSALGGYGWPAVQMIDFSYAGAGWSGSSWQPSGYNCVQTRAGLDAGVAQLDAQLRAYLAVRPRSRFVLVGHSFGGLIGWWITYWGYTSGAPVDNVAGLVTVDSPLLGIGPSKADFLNVRCYVERSAADASTDSMNGLQINRAYYQALWPQVASWATARGIRVRTLGNDSDCAYAPMRGNCDVPFGSLFGDEAFTQYVPSVSVGFNYPVLTSWPETLGIGRTGYAHSALLRFGQASVAQWADWAAQAR